jgi:single-stranded-DNA-specific exonuclease
VQPVRRRSWRVKESDRALSAVLSRELSVSGFLATLLLNRGLTETESARRFLSSSLAEISDPFLLLGMSRAADRLSAAVIRCERVCVYGDYDVDGVSAVALLISFFRELGLDCFYYIPDRLSDGYGMSHAGVETVAALGARIIITVDCGITAVAEAVRCSDLHIDLIITDHHTPGDSIPPACAVINPHQPGCRFPSKTLAGVGVAFYVLIALRSRLREDGFFTGRAEPDLREYLDLVALGTIADIVPLVDENRVFVKYGLEKLSNSTRAGVQALKEVSGVSGPVSCGQVGFRLAPRINAAGRLEDASLGVELLLCNDPVKAVFIARQLDMSNQERQEIEQSILSDALKAVKASDRFASMKSIVLASSDWHPGVIGIVASRLVDLFHRPAILIALKEGVGRGSGRSIPGFHLLEALNSCSEQLLKFGGHKYAAGLSIDEQMMEAFVLKFDEIARKLLTDDDLIPILAIDAELSPEAITLELEEMIALLAPFGAGNPEPVFMLKDVTLLEQRILKERHLKLRMTAGGATFEAIGFNMSRGETVPKKLDVAFSLDFDSWNGTKRIQLRMRDYREATGQTITSNVQAAGSRTIACISNGIEG